MYTKLNGLQPEYICTYLHKIIPYLLVDSAQLIPCNTVKKNILMKSSTLPTGIFKEIREI